MSSFSPVLRAGLLAAALVGAVVAFGAGGCANSSTTPVVAGTPSPFPSASLGPSPSPTPAPQNFVWMRYGGSTPTANPTYGQVNGYSSASAAPSPGTSPQPSQVITVTANQTIQFFNTESRAHTASLLGNANGTNWPATFTNNNGSQNFSPPGTAITLHDFSTGTIGSNGSSFVYNTGAVGMYYFGDAFCYLAGTCGPAPMRTVIIVQ